MSARMMQHAALKIREDWADCDCHKFERAVADWLMAEAEAHVHLPGRTKAVYDMPGMDEAPAVRVARAYLNVDEGGDQW